MGGQWKPFTSASLAAFLCLALLACGGEPSPEEHVAQAKKILDASQGEILLVKSRERKLAIAELKKALQRDGGNLEASLLLGNVLYEEGRLADAEHWLAKTYEAGGSPNELIPLRAEILLATGELDTLDGLSIDGLTAEGRSTVQAAKAGSLLEQDKPALAMETIEAALQNETVSVYAEVVAARIAMDTTGYEDAREALLDIVARYPKYAPAWRLLGDVESARGQASAALAAYNQYIALAGVSAQALLNVALWKVYTGNIRSARRDLIELEESHQSVKTSDSFRFLKGLILMQNKDKLYGARKTFVRNVDDVAAYPQSLYYLAALNLELGLLGHEPGSIELALSRAYEFLRHVPDSAAGVRLAAKIELVRGGYRNAESLLRPLLRKQPNDGEALELMARALVGLGRNVDAVEVLTRLRGLRPDSLAVRAQLGAAYLAAGEQATGEFEDLGEGILQDLLADYPGYDQADILLVLNHLRHQRIAKALEAAEAYRARNPSDATPYMLLGRAYLAGNDGESAKAAFATARELRPGDPEAAMGLAEFALLETDYDAARQYYREIIQRHPDHMRAWMALASTFATEGREQEMLEILRKASAADLRAVEPRLAIVRYHVARGELDEATFLMRGFTEQEKALPETLETLALSDLADGRLDQALYALQDLVQLRPGIAQYHYLLAKTYAEMGSDRRMIAELQQAAELGPDHFHVKLANARLALATEQLERFDRLLSELLDMAPNNPEVMKLEAWSDQNKGNGADARRLFEMVYDSQPVSENLVALAVQRYRLGDARGAIQLLTHWLNDHPDDVVALERLGEFYARGGDLAAATDQYQAILRLRPDHGRALNNLAWCLLDDDPEDALHYAESAAAIYENSSAVYDTLAMAQLRNGQLAAAKRSIGRARELDPENTAFRRHEAEILAAAN
ncbi:MAG: PEP-CTERM system TPR-repeat protein PrsT [Halioglobus sp.]|nr:PEP-CTERM system TPR-repeat protein PrsT [Halioglobus sp.]